MVGSGWGLCELRAGRAAAWAGGIGVPFGLLLTVVTAVLAGRTPPLTDWTAAHGHPPTAAEVGARTQFAWWAWPTAALAGLVLLDGVLLWLGRRLLARRAAGVGLVAAGLAGVLLGTGLLSTGLYLTGGAGTPSYNQAQATTVAGIPPTTRDEVAAGAWLAAHSAPGDVLAVNRFCLQPAGAAECTAKNFTLSALAGRDTDVGGWAYASRVLDSGWHTPVWYADQPFWDPARLADEQAAFSRPTARLLDRLYRTQGVRWLVADAGGHPADSATLDRLAVRRLTLPAVTVWELRTPAG